MDEPPVFRDEFYPKILVKSLHELRNCGALCDVILICDGEIPAHRLILSAASPYFRGMFNLGLKESKEERIEINCMDGVVLVAAVDFIYSGELSVCDDLLLPLLEASSLLQLGSLRSACMHRLTESATPYSTLDSCGSLAHKLGLLELENYVHRLTIENFETVAFGDQQQQWLDAPVEVISPLINHSSIFSQPVILVAKALIKWILHDITGKREIYLESFLPIFRHIRKSHLELEIRDLITQKTEIYEWLSSHCIKSVSTRKAPCIKELQVVVVIGGLSGGPDGAMKTVECYVADTSLSSPWTLYLPENASLHSEYGVFEKTSAVDHVVPPMSFSRVFAASAYLDHEIFVIGGENGRFTTKADASVECYNIVLNRWRSVAGIPLPEDALEAETGTSMGYPLRLVGAAAAFVEGDLYVCGGRLEPKEKGYLSPTKWMVADGFLRATWVFNKGCNKWRKCSPLLKARAYHGAASVNGVLYAVGGIGAEDTGQLTECLDLVESFDPWNGVWRNVTILPSPRSYFGCMTFRQYIYVVGGHNLGCCQDTVFVYDTISDTWHSTDRPLRTPVDSLAACSLKYPVGRTRNAETHSFIVGGRNSHAGIRDANTYNFTTNRWHCLQSLNYSRIGASAGILKLGVMEPTPL